MERFGREALRLWKLHAPGAFDALRDPVVYFGHIDAHYRVVAEQLAREDADRHDEERELRFWIEQRSQSLLETMPRPPREETFLDDVTEQEVVDPWGRFVRGGLPHRPHRLWDLLEDPGVPAKRFQRELRAWYETLPRAPWVEHAGAARPLFDPDGPGAVVRAAAGARPEIRVWPEATVLTFAPGGVEGAFQVLSEAMGASRAWAGGGYVDRSERGLVLPPWRDDGSAADPAELATMERDCGALQRGVEYVVTAGRPRVVDFDAVAWSARASTAGPASRPWLLLDVDGVVLPAGGDGTALDAALAGELDRLAQVYDLAWATSWGGSANVLLRGSGRSPWPVVADVPVLGGDPDGYDGARVAPVLEFVGDRPFAWVEDELSRQDASVLTADYECLLLRPNPRRGISRDHLDALWAWVSGTPSALEQR